MRDTASDAESVRLAAVRGMDPVERLRQAFAHSEFVRGLAFARLRALHPESNDLELVELMLGRRLVPRESGPGRTPHA